MANRRNRKSKRQSVRKKELESLRSVCLPNEVAHHNEDVFFELICGNRARLWAKKDNCC